MHTKRRNNKKEVPAENLTAVLRNDFAGMILFLAFSISDSSERWAKQCLADFTHILFSRGIRYWWDRSNPMYHTDEDDEPVIYQPEDDGLEDGGVWREVNYEHILAKASGTLKKKQFGSLRVYRVGESYRKTLLVLVNMQFGQFMSIASRWGVQPEDANLSDGPHYCWIEVPIPKPRRTPRRKKLTQ